MRARDSLRKYMFDLDNSDMWHKNLKAKTLGMSLLMKGQA